MSSVAALVLAAQIFLFHTDDVWLNLHQFLYVLGRHEAAMPDRTRRATAGAPADQERGLASLTPAEQQLWREVVSVYAQGLSRQDAVFDEQLVRIEEALARAGSARRLTNSGLDASLVALLEKAAPLYRKAWWPAHQRANAEWVRAIEPLVAKHGDAVLSFLTRAYDLPWPKAGYPIRVSGYANWAGAFSITGRLLLISSLDSGTRGVTALEIVFHESMHQWDDDIDAALDRATTGSVPDGLSHALIFFTAGEAVRAAVPGYVPYAETNGMWKQKRTGQFKPALDAVWLPYLKRRGTRDEALRELLRQTGGQHEIDEGTRTHETPD